MREKISFVNNTMLIIHILRKSKRVLLRINKLLKNYFVIQQNCVEGYELEFLVFSWRGSYNYYLIQSDDKSSF